MMSSPEAMGLGDMDKRDPIPFNGEMKSAKAWGLEPGLIVGTGALSSLGWPAARHAAPDAVTATTLGEADHAHGARREQ